MHIQGAATHQLFKPIISIVAAAALAGVVALLTTVAPGPAASAGAYALPQSTPKTDRLPLARKGTACSARAWPDFEQTCQFDLRKPADDVQKVRVIALR
jgi:hypothetical protein